MEDEDEAAESEWTWERRRERLRRQALVMDVSWIGGLQSLETLAFDAGNSGKDLGWLRQLSKLKDLTLHNLTAIKTLEFLVPLTNLKSIFLYQVPSQIQIPESVKRKVKEIQAAPLGTVGGVRFGPILD